MIARDDFFDPASGQRDPVIAARGDVEDSPPSSVADAAVEASYDGILAETARIRTEIDGLVKAWEAAGSIVSRRLAEWVAAKDISAVGLAADLAFVFLLESPAVREVMSRILRGASGLLGKLILRRKAALARIEDLSVEVASDVVRSNAEWASRLNTARAAEVLARNRMEGFAATLETQLPPSPGRRTGIPDRTPRFDFGANKPANRARQEQFLNERHTEAVAELGAAIKEADAELAKQLAQARKQVNLASAVQIAIGTPQAQEIAKAAADTAYKLVDPTGYGKLSPDPVSAGQTPSGRRDNIPIDLAFIDEINLVAIRLKDELGAIERAAAKLLRGSSRGNGDQFGSSYLSLKALMLNILPEVAAAGGAAISPLGFLSGAIPQKGPAATVQPAESVAAPGGGDVRRQVIKRSEEILWAWLLYEPYFKPPEGLTPIMQYSEQVVAIFASGSDWPPPDTAIEYLYEEFIAPADDGWLADAMDMFYRFGRGVEEVESLFHMGADFLPDSVHAKPKTPREAEIIVHFRKLHDAMLAPILSKTSP